MTTYQLTVFAGDHNGSGPSEFVLAEVTTSLDEVPWDALTFEAQQEANNRPDLFVPRFVDGCAFPRLMVYRLGRKNIPVTRML